MARATTITSPPVLPRLRFSDYVITPADILAWVRGLTWRDTFGLVFMAAAGLALGLRLADLGAGLFAAGLMTALWWRIDSRWPLGIALVLLVLIPVVQYAYDRNWLFAGGNITGGLAVAVWYLLAIGVVRQLLELRTHPATTHADVQTEAAAPTTSPPPRRPPIDPLLRRSASRSATSTPPTPSWRRRLAAIERESAAYPARRHALDGLGRNPSPPRKRRP